MTRAQTGDSSETIRLLGRATSGDGSSWGTLLTRQEGEAPPDGGLPARSPIARGRVDAVDVLQESLGRHVALKVLPFHRLVRESQFSGSTIRTTLHSTRNESFIIHAFRAFLPSSSKLFLIPCLISSCAAVDE